MHFLKVIFAIFLCSFSWVGTVLAATEDLNLQNKNQCLGRTIFNTASDITWHLLDERWTYTDRTGLGIYSPDIRLADKQLSYGVDPTNRSSSLVTVEVSPKTTIEVFDDLVGRHSPSEFESKKRVLQNKIDELSVKRTNELYDVDLEQYESIHQKERELSKLIKRLEKASVEIFVLNDFIKQFKGENRPTEHFEIELKAYEEEYKTYPTDKRYTEEIAFDFGMPDGYGAPYPDKLVVLVWRDERIYRFAFGQQSDYSHKRSSFEKLVPIAKELLSRFRTRGEFEIPEETGFCIPFGFVADDGKAPYQITMAWHPTDNPELLYSLSLSDNIDKAMNLLSVLTAQAIGNPYPSVGNIETFGPTSIEIGERGGIIGGKYFQPMGPKMDSAKAAERYIITAGHANRGLNPSLVLKAKSISETQPQSFADAKADFLQTLKSFRLLPGIKRLADNEQAKK